MPPPLPNCWRVLMPLGSIVRPGTNPLRKPPNLNPAYTPADCPKQEKSLYSTYVYKKYISIETGRMDIGIKLLPYAT